MEIIREVIYTFTNASPAVFSARTRAFIKTFQLALLSRFVSGADKVLERCNRAEVQVEAGFPSEINFLDDLQVDEGFGFADAVHLGEFLGHEI
jgi:hypothetical protein